MTTYLLNSPIVPVALGDNTEYKIHLRRLFPSEVRFLIKTSETFVSAIGHEGTSALLTKILNIEIPFNRVSVYIKEGDILISFSLKERLPEGKVLSQEELAKLEYQFVIAFVYKRRHDMYQESDYFMSEHCQ